jgi:hypothetical protein
MFRDPVKFTRFEPYTAPPMAPDFRRAWINTTGEAASAAERVAPVATPSKREAKRLARLARS